jgi:hypothetical protein
MSSRQLLHATPAPQGDAAGVNDFNLPEEFDGAGALCGGRILALPAVIVLVTGLPAVARQDP